MPLLTACAFAPTSSWINQYRQDARLQGAITFGMNAVVAQGSGQLLQVGQTVGGQLKFD